MPSTYTIVLWCADTSHLASFAGAHLLHTGLHTANRGRVGDDIPVAIGVASSRRWPIVSREVSARGVLRARRPNVDTRERFDYLLTFESGLLVESGKLARQANNARVIAAHELLQQLEARSPGDTPKAEIISLFNSLARQPQSVPALNDHPTNLRHIADLCQRLVAALNR